MSLLVAFVVILLLLLLGVPVAFSLAFGTFLYFVWATDISLTILVQRMVGGVESVPLLAVLFFVTAGILMNYTGIARRIMDFSQVLTGRLPGSMGHVNVLLSTFMGGLSGSSLADAAMEAKMIVPEMIRKGYSTGFSSALTAATAIITPIIPPGIAMIIYGYIGNVSIGRLFMAGVMPGIVLTVLMMAAVHFIARRRGYLPTRDKVARPREILISARPALLAFVLPVVIIGGIRIGVFTPTEAGAMAVVFALFFGFLYREMKFRHLVATLKESVWATSSIMLIIAAASGLGWILTWERIPQRATEFVTGLVHTPELFLLLINVFLLIIGMFLEGNVILVILTPIFMPIVQAYGIDPVHFGMVFILNLAIGSITPPMGTVMFTTCSITGCKFTEFVREALPFYLVCLIALLIVTYIPSFSLWLPNLTFK